MTELAVSSVASEPALLSALYRIDLKGAIADRQIRNIDFSSYMAKQYQVPMSQLMKPQEALSQLEKSLKT